MQHRKTEPWTILILLFVMAGLVLSGCDNVLGGDDDDESNGGGQAGALTASVSGVPMDLESTTADNDLLFAAFVFETGTDVLTESWEDTWVALVAEEIDAGSASGRAFQTGDDNLPEWQGTTGENYAVYLTIYRVTIQEEGPPTKGGEYFWLSNPECIYGTVDWQSPATYEHDGDKTISSSFDEYLGTAEVEFVAQGALHLVGRVMDNITGQDPPSEGDIITIVAEEIIAEVTSVTPGDPGYVTLEVEVTDYVFPDLTPAPTATGDITLDIVATEADGPQEIGITTTNLVLTHEGDSVTVQMDGTASDLVESGPETLTGTFTYDGAVHDLSVLDALYEMRS